MTYEEFDTLIDTDYNVETMYMEYIMENADPSEVTICNGDTLIEAVERGYLFEDFYAHCMKAGIENI